MPPSDPIHELLPWFVAGTLDPVETEAFRRHLPGCPTCRDELAVLESLRVEVERHGEEFFRDHPTADRLVAAVRGDLREETGMADTEAAEVRRHLALCSTCAEEARWATGESTAAGTAATASTVRGTRMPAASRPWAWALVAAAATFAVMLPWGLRDRAGPSATGLPPSFFVAGTERGSSGVTTFTVSDEDPVIQILFEVDLGASAFPVSFEVRDAAGTTVISKSGIPRERLASETILTAICARRDCPDGSYTGIIRPASSSGEPDIKLPFRLRGE